MAAETGSAFDGRRSTCLVRRSTCGVRRAAFGVSAFGVRAADGIRRTENVELERSNGERRT